jgi:hypothetical protein
MQLPFNRSEFLDVFAALNLAIWPFQAIATLVGVLTVSLLFWRPSWADRFIALALAVMWFVAGIAYHWRYFSAINDLAILFGAFFVGAGFLFAVEGALRGRIRFQAKSGFRYVLGLVLAGYALVVYPMIGMFLTEPWPETPLFGTAPCPTVIFTFGLLMVAQYPRKWLLAAVPVLWGVIGGSAAFLLDMPQDYGLIVAVVAWFAVEKLGRRREARRAN